MDIKLTKTGDDAYTLKSTAYVLKIFLWEN